MLRTQLYADAHNLFLHDLILASCRHNSQKIALIDSSCGRRISYAEYGELVEALAAQVARNRSNMLFPDDAVLPHMIDIGFDP